MSAKQKLMCWLKAKLWRRREARLPLDWWGWQVTRGRLESELDGCQFRMPCLLFFRPGLRGKFEVVKLNPAAPYRMQWPSVN